MTYQEPNPHTLKAIADARSQGFIDEYRSSGSSGQMLHAEMFLMPTFWQTLGKARGWGWHCIDCGTQAADRLSFYCTLCEHMVRLHIGWVHHWHLFIDHLAEGKDAESFFALLNNNKEA